MNQKVVIIMKCVVCKKQLRKNEVNTLVSQSECGYSGLVVCEECYKDTEKINSVVSKLDDILKVTN